MDINDFRILSRDNRENFYDMTIGSTTRNILIFLGCPFYFVAGAVSGNFFGGIIWFLISYYLVWPVLVRKLYQTTGNKGICIMALAITYILTVVAFVIIYPIAWIYGAIKQRDFRL